MTTQAPSSTQSPHKVAHGQFRRNLVIGAAVVLALALGLVALADRMQAGAQVTTPTVAVFQQAAKPVADQPIPDTNVPDAATALRNKAEDTEPAPQAF